MTVPDRGFLLNNELTDFSFLPNPADPNIVEPGKRPRSSMSPTIVLDEGDLRYVVGSPGGSMIITTVTQVLMNRIDLGMTLPEAVAAPRASQRNTAAVAAEPAFRAAYEAAPHAVRAHVHHDGRDRRGGGHRGRRRRAHDRGRRAGAPRRRNRPGGRSGRLSSGGAGSGRQDDSPHRSHPRCAVGPATAPAGAAPGRARTARGTGAGRARARGRRGG